jgi:alginate O-acetyltransferase complex protein AlgI
LYIPLGGSRNGKLKAIRNVFIVFVISGLWHGANLTFLAWGGIHAALYLPLFIIGRTKQYNIGTKQAEQAFHLLDILKMLGCFLIVTLAWVFFRSPDINTALHYLFIIATDNNLKPEYTNGLGVVVTLLALDWSVRKNERDIQFSSKRWVRTVIYLIMAALIYQGLFSNEAEFIYFQF